MNCCTPTNNQDENGQLPRNKQNAKTDSRRNGKSEQTFNLLVRRLKSVIKKIPRKKSPRSDSFAG